MSLIGAEIRTTADDSYPSMKRLGCQFDIRQHATLGLIGSFSDYDPMRGTDEVFEKSQAVQAAGLSSGALEVTIAYRHGSYHEMRTMTYSAILRDEVFERRPMQQISHRLLISPLYFFPMHLLMQKTPGFVIDVFPWGRLYHHWHNSLVVMELIRPFRPSLSAPNYRQDTHLQAQILGTDDDSCTACGWSPAQFPCHVLREACLMMLEGVEEFREWRAIVPFSRLLSLRSETHEQIRFLDQWLERKEGGLDLDSSRGYSLFKTTVTASNIIQAFGRDVDLLKRNDYLLEQSAIALNKFIDAFPTASALQSLGQADFATNERLRTLERLFDPKLDARNGEERYQAVVRQLVAFRTWWDGRHPEIGSSEYDNLLISNVIIWRAALVAVLFCLANDNTALLDSGVWHDIIPIM